MIKSETPAGSNAGDQDVLVAKSTGGLFPHTHTLVIPKSLIDHPTEDGVLLSTSEEYSLIFKHKHQVRLSGRDLQSLREGLEVVVRDSDRGRHSFVIRGR